MLIIGELLKQADLYISEGLNPTIITEGFDKAKDKALEVWIVGLSNSLYFLGGNIVTKASYTYLVSWIF